MFNIPIELTHFHTNRSTLSTSILLSLSIIMECWHFLIPSQPVNHNASYIYIIDVVLFLRQLVNISTNL